MIDNMGSLRNLGVTGSLDPVGELEISTEYGRLSGAFEISFAPATRRLFIALSVLTSTVFLLMTMGAIVRNMGAGLSCPDWPLCQGKLIPPMDPQVFAEWFHRLIASIVSFGFFGIAIVVARNKDYRQHFGFLTILALGLLFSQILLGGLTVLGLLKYEIVTSHLAVGFLFFGTLLIMTLKARDLAGISSEYSVAQLSETAKKGVQKFARFSVFASIAVYLQVLLGGMVASNYAGLACTGFPTCNGQIWPPMHGLVAIQMTHRIGALLVFIKVSMVVARGLRTQLPIQFKRLSIGAGILLCTQVSLGISAVLFGMPIFINVVHHTIAAALFGTLLVMSYESSRIRLH